VNNRHYEVGRGSLNKAARWAEWLVGQEGLSGPQAAQCAGLLPKDLHEQTRVTMKAAWRLAPKDGIAKLKQYAQWLRTEPHSAADSLLEGLDERFTVNQLGLSAPLRRGLCTTNLIESVHSGVRGKLPRAARYRSADMARRWVAAALLATERKLRRLTGYADLWMLEAVLKDTQEEPAAKAA